MSLLLMIGLGFIVLSVFAPILGALLGIMIPALLVVLIVIGSILFLGAVIGYMIKGRKGGDGK